MRSEPRCPRFFDAYSARPRNRLGKPPDAGSAAAISRGAASAWSTSTVSATGTSSRKSSRCLERLEDVARPRARTPRGRRLRRRRARRRPAAGSRRGARSVEPSDTRLDVVAEHEQRERAGVAADRRLRVGGAGVERPARRVASRRRRQAAAPSSPRSAGPTSRAARRVPALAIALGRACGATRATSSGRPAISRREPGGPRAVRRAASAGAGRASRVSPPPVARDRRVRAARPSPRVKSRRG